jgi:hypothetical protein
VGSSVSFCGILFVVLIGTPVGIRGAIAVSSPIPSIKTLNYDNTTFFIKKAPFIHFGTIPLEIANNTAVMNFNNTIFAVWSRPLQQHNVNFIEVRFRVIDRANTGDSHAGIVWNDGHKIWYAFLRERGLSVYNSVDKEFARNTKLMVQNGSWNTLAIAILKNDIDVYVNNVLGLKIPYANASYSISNVGVKNYDAIVEFKPIMVGQVPS